MKRNLDNLTAGNIKGIKEWLDRADPETFCPFVDRGDYHSNYCSKCHDLLPSLDDDRCPCQIYSLSHLERVARQVIKQWEAAHGPLKRNDRNHP